MQSSKMLTYEMWRGVPLQKLRVPPKHNSFQVASIHPGVLQAHEKPLIKGYSRDAGISHAKNIGEW